jgi:hypothetical protein
LTTSTAERVAKHRAALRKAGLRPIQIWVPDTRSKGFAEECRRQSLLIRNSPNRAKEARELELWNRAAADDGWS